MSANGCDVHVEMVAIAGPASCHGALLVPRFSPTRACFFFFFTKGGPREKKNLSANTEIYILRALVAFISFLFTTKRKVMFFRDDHRAQGFRDDHKGFPGGSAGKESAFNAGDLGSIPELGRCPGKRKGYPLQYSDLENSMDFIVHGGCKESDTTERLSLTSLQTSETLMKSESPKA